MKLQALKKLPKRELKRKYTAYLTTEHLRILFDAAGHVYGSLGTVQTSVPDAPTQQRRCISSGAGFPLLSPGHEWGSMGCGEFVY